MDENFGWEYIQNCFGRDEDDNSSNCIVSLSVATVQGDLSDPDNIEIIDSNIRNTEQAEFTLIPQKDYVTIDLQWPNYIDPDIRVFWNQFKRYEEQLKNAIYNDGSVERPVIIMNVFSKELVSKGHLAITNPLFWSLYSSNVGTNDCDTIRIFAAFEDIDFIPVEDEDEFEQELTDAEALASRNSRQVLQEK